MRLVLTGDQIVSKAATSEYGAGAMKICKVLAKLI